MPTSSASVFISHSSQDKAFVNLLAGRLKAAGVQKIWYDALDVGPAADDLPRRIEDAIASADFFLIVLSPGSQRSPWVNYEIQAALDGGKIVIPLVVGGKSSVDLRDNPYVNELLRGGRHKVIEAGSDVEDTVSQILLVLSPEQGRLRIVEQTLTAILDHDDPDAAELAMTRAALMPDDYLPRLLQLIPDGRDDVKPRYRLARSLTYFGEQALPPLLALLLRRHDIPSVPIPGEIPYDVDAQSGETSYTGRSVSQVLRHIHLSGGDRAWKAQVVAQRCILVLADSAKHYRKLSLQALELELGAALQQIPLQDESAVLSGTRYDALRLSIETAGLLAREPGSPDPWLIQEFAKTELWGPDESADAKNKLVTYIVECLSRIGGRKALDYLLGMADDDEIRGLFFETRRIPNPWNGCFVNFGNMAVDALLDRLATTDDLFRPFALENLAGIPNPRGLRAVLEAIRTSGPDADVTSLLSRAARQAVPEISDEIVRAFDEDPLVYNALDRTDVDAAVATACVSATDKAIVTRVCTALARSGDAHTVWQLTEAIRAHRIHSLYDFLGTAFQAHPSSAVRGGAAIALSKLGEIAPEPIARQLRTAEEHIERPYLSIALAQLGDGRAIDGLVDGLKHSFLSGNMAAHDRYAEALGMLSDPRASELRTKWFKRI